MTRILGIDPGTTAGKCAYGYIEVCGYHWRIGATGTVNLPKSSAKVPLGIRLNTVRQSLAAIVGVRRPDAIVTEAPGSGSKYNNKQLVKVCGAAEMVAGMYGIAYVEYVTSTIKMEVAGHGHAKKPAVALAVERFLGCDPIGDEEISDALAGAICHAIKSR